MKVKASSARVAKDRLRDVGALTLLLKEGMSNVPLYVRYVYYN